MKQIPDSFFAPNALGQKEETTALFLIAPNPVGHLDWVPEISPEQRRRILKDLLMTIDTAHREGWVLGDISEKNILWSAGEEKVFFIDVDSWRRIGRVGPSAQGDSEGYDYSKLIDVQNHEIKSRLGGLPLDSDLFKLSVMIMRILVRDIRIKHGDTASGLATSEIGKSLSSEQLDRLIHLWQQNSFSILDSLGLRPSAQDWLQALS
jgi:hypothetical protein